MCKDLQYVNVLAVSNTQKIKKMNFVFFVIGSGSGSVIIVTDLRIRIRFKTLRIRNITNS
jgi:hypothetical protein